MKIMSSGAASSRARFRHSLRSLAPQSINRRFRRQFGGRQGAVALRRREDVVRIAGQERQGVGQILVAYESYHTIEFLVRRGVELLGYAGDAVGVVSRVAYGKRRFGDPLPAAA